MVRVTRTRSRRTEMVTRSRRMRTRWSMVMMLPMVMMITVQGDDEV